MMQSLHSELEEQNKLSPVFRNFRHSFEKIPEKITSHPLRRVNINCRDSSRRLIRTNPLKKLESCGHLKKKKYVVLESASIRGTACLWSSSYFLGFQCYLSDAPRSYWPLNEIYLGVTSKDTANQRATSAVPTRLPLGTRDVRTGRMHRDPNIR